MIIIYGKIINYTFQLSIVIFNKSEMDNINNENKQKKHILTQNVTKDNDAEITIQKYQQKNCFAN